MNESDAINKKEFLAAIHAFSLTHIGLVRHDNQDAIGIFEVPELKLYAVADGMGGAAGGAHASKIAISAFKNVIQNPDQFSEQKLGEAVLRAHELISSESRRVPGLLGMGTTLVGAAFHGNHLFVVNVGDSRAYLIRGNKIVLLTEDHTVAAELLRAGTLSPDQTKTTPVSHMLTRSLGAPSALKVDCFVGHNMLARGDKILLCSDGLHGQVKDEVILSICSSYSSSEILEQLVKRANQNGGQDNVSIVLIEVSEAYPVAADEINSDINLKKVEFSGDEPDPSSSEGLSHLAQAPLPAIRSEDLDELPHPHTLSINPIPALVILLLCFLLGLVVGVRGPEIYARILGESYRYQNHDAATQAEIAHMESREHKPVATVLTGDDTKQHRIPEPDFSNLTMEELTERLEGVRIRLDVATRKLILWQGRKERIKEGEPAEFASEVSVSAPTVRSKLSVYQSAHIEYLREAEVLIYNPADPDQEGKVEGLSLVQIAALDDLNKEVLRVVDRGVTSSLAEITSLSRERDKLQSLIQMQRRKKDAAEATPEASVSNTAE